MLTSRQKKLLFFNHTSIVLYVRLSKKGVVSVSFQQFKGYDHAGVGHEVWEEDGTNFSLLNPFTSHHAPWFCGLDLVSGCPVCSTQSFNLSFKSILAFSCFGVFSSQKRSTITVSCLRTRQSFSRFCENTPSPKLKLLDDSLGVFSGYHVSASFPWCRVTWETHWS